MWLGEFFVWTLRRFTLLLFVVVAGGVLFRPISSPECWYEMCRGGVVLDGFLRPSHRLLIQESSADANWLGGVPFAVLNGLGGVSGLMNLKVLIGAFVAARCWRLTGCSRSPQTCCWLCLALLANLANWDVTASLWDVIGLVLLFECLQKDRTPGWREFVVLWIWAQLGTLVVVGLATWCLVRIFEPFDPTIGGQILLRDRWRWGTLAIVVCQLTPRGVHTLLDSLRLAVPRLFEDGSMLAETEWRPLFLANWDVSHLGFLILAGSSIGVASRRPMSFPRIVLVLLASGMGLLCQRHIGIASIWLLMLLTCQTQHGVLSPIQLSSSRPRIIDSAWGLAMTVLAIVSWWPIEGRRPGWGLDPRVDERLLGDAISTTSWKGTIWADDILSAGMSLWVTNQRVRVHDIPERALLGGRLTEFVRLRRDLEQGRLMAYRREDQSAGGWWLPLRDRDTDLIVVGAERTQLIRSLEPTLWKPLSLDSPVLPFGKSGEHDVSHRIVDVLRQRDFVENQNWSPSLLGAAGNDRCWDVWGVLRVSANVEQELRQARVLQAFQLPRAGLRLVESAMRTSSWRSLAVEATKCRRELDFDLTAHPGPSVADLKLQSPDLKRCGACHAEQTKHFGDAGHHNTLRPLDRERASEVFGPTTLTDPVEVSDVRMSWKDDTSQCVSSSRQIERGIPLQWLFGSGRHARTPVSLWINSDGRAEVLEHRLSWYPPHQWSTTLGLKETTFGTSPATGFPGKDVRRSLESLGKIHDPAATRDCFGCHTTRSPISDDQRFVNDQPVFLGVSCDRCHPGSADHAQHQDHGSAIRPFDNWQSLSPLESVNRCGECHRRADHFTPDELNPDNPLLLRFASVGLVQSACFRRQTSTPSKPTSRSQRNRFDCITCHDPHRPLETDAAVYAARCADCHSADAPRCSQQPNDSNCLPCHMPKVEVQPPLRFTDHWIRVRKSP